MKVSVNGIKLNRWYVYSYNDETGITMQVGVFETYLPIKEFWDLLTQIYKERDIFVREEPIEESIAMDMAVTSESSGLHSYKIQ